ncbi:hypothetical protein ACJX0J_038401, partial [Zea mays]
DELINYIYGLCNFYFYLNYFILYYFMNYTILFRLSCGKIFLFLPGMICLIFVVGMRLGMLFLLPYLVIQEKTSELSIVNPVGYDEIFIVLLTQRVYLKGWGGGRIGLMIYDVISGLKYMFIFIFVFLSIKSERLYGPHTEYPINHFKTGLLYFFVVIEGANLYFL